MPLTATVWADAVRVPENRSALRAVRRLARGLTTRGRPVSPLVLHGPTGCGKSLLANALVAATATGGRSARTLAANDLDPRPTDDDDAFAPALACDLLVVEDLQHLPERSAEWLRRLLDGRAAHRRATVLTANVGPAALVHLPRRLTSRLVAGLVVPIDPLGPESRRRVLAGRAERLGLRLTASALRWLADQPTGGGLRPPLGMLDTLKAATRGNPAAIDRDTAERLLAPRNSPANGFDAIALKVAAAFDVKPKDLRGPSRLRTILVARQVAMYLAHDAAGFSLPAVGRAFDRDHTTVLHAVRKVRERIDGDKTFAGRVKQLAGELA
jgi:chromosomal replication initiator protein